MTNKVILLSSLVFAALVGCDNESDSDVETVSPPPIPADDVDLIDNLVPHHELALEMADVEIARGTRQDVKDMAQMMKNAQQEEIARLRSIRMEVAGSDKIAAMRDPHGQGDVAELQAAAGADVDRMFLENMIPHHAGAVSLSHRALENLTNAELRDMARMTINVQTREMNEMLDMLGR